mgnify:CR=1 FL=1
MTKDEKIRLILRQLNGASGEQEEKDFSNWLLQDPGNLDLYIEIKKIWNTSVSPDFSFKEADARQKLDKAIEKDKRKIRIQRYLRNVAAVSTLLIILSIFSFFYFRKPPDKNVSVQTVHYITKQSKPGEQLRLTLPDASVVNLNAGSSITFPEKFSEGRRQIKLYGEAFFNVTRNPECPFVITSNGITTTVLGTSFNIKAFDKNDFTITVATGKVKVEKQDAGQLYLLPNQQATYHKRDRQFSTKEVDASNYFMWISGTLQFNNDPLDEAVRMLERWYNVEIQLQDKSYNNIRINGNYKDKKLYTILDGLCYMYHLKYQYINDSVIVMN